ncbi:uncharacterized protein LOC131229599 [Magnolia sinica]|uniref:uncharacterized protein LOC131229599 n=1 Tax=Magnolia sinica TaxID=86752 RepID=UPI002657DB94|nr:uncharacterized protein LOC131229599 [Magnolia sinica]
MEEEQEQRRCCRFCKKRFPCGRSLGGHMRSHMTTMNSSEIDENLRRNSNDGGIHNYAGLEADAHAGYGLRENPKKTWRLSDLGGSAGSWKGKVCKDCGKRFQSLKALFGHMKCHTERKPSHRLVDEGSWSGGGGPHKLISHSQSDSEEVAEEALRRRRKSGRMMKNHGASPSFTIASSSVSEVEQEQEDVAICLMMLSRDVGTWGGLNSVADSSDNNSVILEVRSSEMFKISSEKEDAGFVCNDSELMKVKKKQREKKIEDLNANDTGCAWFSSKRSELGASESGFSRDGAKKAISNVSHDRFVRDDDFKKPELDGFDIEFTGDEIGYEISNVELVKDSSSKDIMDCSDDEFGSSLCRTTPPRSWGDEAVKDSSNGVDGMEFGKYSWTKRATYDAHDTQFDGNSLGFEVGKKSRYECSTCNKTFNSYQALGGHRASHKRVKGCCAPKTERSEKSFKVDISPPHPADGNKLKPRRIEHTIKGEACYGVKKLKGHECPICFKVFSSGQALGGHKRSHFVGNTESRATACQTIVIQHQVPENPILLDLNLPAPIEEGVNVHVGFESWWVESNHKHEQLVGLISN